MAAHMCLSRRFILCKAVGPRRRAPKPSVTSSIEFGDGGGGGGVEGEKESQRPAVGWAAGWVGYGLTLHVGDSCSLPPACQPVCTDKDDRSVATFKSRASPLISPALPLYQVCPPVHWYQRDPRPLPRSLIASYRGREQSRADRAHDNRPRARDTIDRTKLLGLLGLLALLCSSSPLRLLALSVRPVTTRQSPVANPQAAASDQSAGPGPLRRRHTVTTHRLRRVAQRQPPVTYWIIPQKPLLSGGFTSSSTTHSLTHPPRLSLSTAILAPATTKSSPLSYYSPSFDDFDRESTVDATPVSTPPPARFTPPRSGLGLFEKHHLDEDLVFLGEEEEDYPADSILFEPLAPASTFAGMATSSSASPIDIATPRNSPPIPKTSNLTSQLQAAGAQQMLQNQQRPSYSEARRGSEFKPESFGYGMSNSRPIAVAGSQRRGSTQPGGSLMQGMSWGGMSVGSFIRDDILMGTSPYNNFQSPSFHSSSYLPKMEANFMRDYVCCGITLDSLHELLQHYEEAHAGVPTQTMGRTPRDQQSFNEARPQDTANAAAIMQRQQLQQQTGQGIVPSGLTQGLTKDHHLHGAQDMDELDAMELDDAAPAVQPPQHQFQPQPQFGRQQPRAPTLNTGLGGGFGGSQLSTPTTPQPNQSFSLSGNPTVSSVNTPTFGTTSDSMTSTPTDYTSMDTPKAGQNDGFDYSNFGMGQDLVGTIDDPAKRLLSKQGFGNGQATAQADLARRIREQQISAGMDPNTFGFGNDEIKPFRCPVIGCEKAYKNQNGLKYHKQHGHTNQQLKENPDGTFSIVDPTTSIPYPGTIGMEKEKPYRCEVCGKRYKNLNGLKYHRQHSPPCNPDLKFNPAINMSNNLGDMNVNVAGAGLVGEGIGM